MSDPPHLSYHESHPLFQELAQQIESLLLKQAIEEVHNPTPGFYSRLFLAPKKTGDWHPVIDLSLLNTYLILPHFRMETPASILRSMVDGAWTSSLDLKDAFLPRPGSSGTQEVPALPVWPSSFPLRSTTIWSDHFALPLYLPGQASRSLCQVQGTIHHPVPQQLASFSSIPTEPQRVDPAAASTHHQLGSSGQPTEVRPDP